MSASGKATILLYGLDPSLEVELASVLKQFEVKTCHADALESIEGADLVFCSALGAQLRNVLELTNRGPARPPVIVVSRLPEVSRWLDAMEAGANDYCAAPFEKKHLGWILRSNIPTLNIPALPAMQPSAA